MKHHKIGYFVGKVGNVEKLFAHLDVIQPPVLTFLDDPENAVRAKKRYPDCVVIWRQNRQYRAHGGTRADSDGLLHVDYPNHKDAPYAGSDAFLDERVRILDALGWERNIFIKLHNEASWSPAVLAWQQVTAERAVARGIPVAVGGWAVGNPPVDRISEALPMLRLAGANPHLVKVVLNEYFAGAWVSGFTHDGITQPGDSLYFTRLIPRDQWPKTMDGITAYHCGRYRFWVKVCEAHGIPTDGLFVIGENQADAVSDGPVDAWRKGLKRVNPQIEPRFYLDLDAQWREWWGLDAEDGLFEQVVAENEVTYNPPAVVGFQLFTEGDSGGWQRANLEHAAKFKRRLETYVSQEIEWMPMPKPANASDRTLVALTGAPEGEINVRAGAGELYRKVGTIRNGERFHIYRTPPLSDRRGRKWYYADVPGVAEPTWVCEVKEGIFVPVAEPSEPSVDIAVIVERLTAIANTADRNVPLLQVELKALQAERAEVEAAKREAEKRVRELDEQLDELAERISEKNHALSREINIRELAKATIEDINSPSKAGQPLFER